MVEQVDWLLFKLLILGGLSDNYGNIWKIVQKQICVVECTLPKLHNYENDDQKSVSMSYLYVTALCHFHQGTETASKCLYFSITFPTNYLCFSKRSTGFLSI